MDLNHKNKIMEETATNHSVLIITGMHRSGTSLTASLLQSAGVYIGDRLMKGGTGNQLGHFEDWDFVDLHRDFLTQQRINREGWTTKANFAFSGVYLQRSHSLIKARSHHQIWGWKDPRTTLFLTCWSGLIPQAKFVFVYRSPWDVVDSLFRRGDLIFKQKPEIAIKTWISYNQIILKFCQQTTQPWILLRLEDVAQNPQSVVDSINQKFSLNLRSPQKLYDRSLSRSNRVNLQRVEFLQQYFPQACELYLQLHQQATLFDQVQTTLEPEFLASKSPHPPWFWQNWLDRPVTRIRTTRSWSKLKRLVTNSNTFIQP